MIKETIGNLFEAKAEAWFFAVNQRRCDGKRQVKLLTKSSHFGNILTVVIGNIVEVISK